MVFKKTLKKAQKNLFHVNDGPVEVNTMTVKCRVLFQNANAAEPLFDTDLSLRFVLWVILYPVACSFWEPYACIRDESPLLFCEKPLGETLGEIPVNCAETHNENLGMKDVWTLPAIFPFYLIPEIFQSAWEKLK